MSLGLILAAAGVGSVLGGAGSSKGGTKAVSTLTAEQSTLLKSVAGFIQPKIGTGATPYTGRLSPEVPDLLYKAFSDFQATYDKYAAYTAEALLNAGKAAYEYAPGATAERWTEGFATPAMNTYERFIAPLTREATNIPGIAFSRSGANAVRQNASDFYTANVLPSLYNAQEADINRSFQSGEAAAARAPGAAAALLALPSTLFGTVSDATTKFMALQEPGLQALYNEFLRTSKEKDPWTQLALQAAGLPATENIVQQGTNNTGDILTSLSGIISALGQTKK